MKKHFLLPITLGLVALAACVDGGTATSSKSKTSRGPVMRTVSFHTNDGTDAKSEATVKNREKVAEPTSDPTRAGYKFLGWTTDESGYSLYDFDTQVTGDLDLYAAWEAEGETQTNRYVFEAEYAPSAITFDGATYSGGARGKACIGVDYDGDFKASNGYFVHFMYVKYEPERNYGSRIEFNFNAAAAGTVSILFRLSAEYGQEDVDITVNKDEWKAKLNGTQLDYETLTFTDVPKQGAGNKAFEDFTLATNVNVQAGANKIEFITDNQKLLFGTAQATAPMLDCLKIKSDTTLTWEEANPSQVPAIE